MLAAIETMANADAVGRSRRGKTDIAAEAATGEAVHPASPRHPREVTVYNEVRLYSKSGRSSAGNRVWVHRTISLPESGL